jgi:multidrug resistance efflux pump
MIEGPATPAATPAITSATVSLPPENAAAQRMRALERLLKVEREARQVESVPELGFLAANETAQLARASQVFVLSRQGRRFEVTAVSSIGRVDRDAPRIRWIEGLVDRLAADAGLGRIHEFDTAAYSKEDDTEGRDYPYRNLAWMPFKLRDGHVFAGLLLARDRLWAQDDLKFVERLGETYEHAWAALTGARRLRRKRGRWPFVVVGAAALLAAGACPVPMSVIAPVEVRSLNTWVVSAPVDGVVAAVSVAPNDPVAKGQVVARMLETTFRNDLAVAERELQVAQAQLTQVTQRAAEDPDARADLPVARTELNLATAKRDYAAELLQRATIVSPLDGRAVFADKQDLVGRPFRTGERILEIADPSAVQLRIDVPVADVIAIKQGAAVRAFLDSDPLHPYSAHVSSLSFEARHIENNQLAYRIYAKLDDATTPVPGIGVRGTAQLFGDRVPLAFYLFRRPLSALRQQFGI